MRLKNNRSGFTLLEIIIVIIIVGILASLALPRLFNMIDYSKSTEALNTIGVIKRAADRCAMASEVNTGNIGEVGLCASWAALGLQDPTTAPGANFTYTLGTTGNTNLSITADYNAGVPADQIVATYTGNTGVLVRSGGGIFSQLQ